MKKQPVILVDMDMILVDMVKPWLDMYNIVAHDCVLEQDIVHYDMRQFCKSPEVLDDILHKPGFFFNLPPMPYAAEGLNRLLAMDVKVLIVTQPPRNAQYAIQDKRDWMKKYIPNFELSDMVFCHRKEYVMGDIFLDDNPSHLEKWKKNNPEGRTASVDLLYNKDIKVNFREDKYNFWRIIPEVIKDWFPHLVEK